MEAISEEVRLTGNGAAKMRMTELPLETMREDLAGRKADLERREADVRDREKAADEIAGHVEWIEERYERTKAADEEQRRLESLRAAIAAETGDEWEQYDEEEPSDAALA
jgi:hypothetical protein